MPQWSLLLALLSLLSMTVGNVGAILQDIQLDVTYLMRVLSEAINDSMSHFSSKLWEEGATEPNGWDLEYDFVTMPGSLLLICHRAEATFGNVAITPLPSFTPQHTVTVTSDQ